MADIVIPNGNQTLQIVPNQDFDQTFPNCTGQLASVNIPAGSPVCVDESVAAGTNVKLARANASSTTFCIGLCVQYAAEGAPCYARFAGPVTLPIAAWDQIGASGGLVVGATYYVSSTNAGFLTTVAPSAGGTFTEAVGVALSPTTMLVGQHLPTGPH
jgi:hypothetical protein